MFSREDLFGTPPTTQENIDNGDSEEGKEEEEEEEQQLGMSPTDLRQQFLADPARTRRILLNASTTALENIGTAITDWHEYSRS
jgi:hypothetical protein